MRLKMLLVFLWAGINVDFFFRLEHILWKEKKQKEIEAKARVQFMTSGLSQRLQSENPFDEFRQAVENAFI